MSEEKVEVSVEQEIVELSAELLDMVAGASVVVGLA